MPLIDKDIGFFEAFFGLVTSPNEATVGLLANGRARHVIKSLLFSALVLLGPIFLYIQRFQEMLYDPDLFYSVLKVFGAWIVLFVIFETIVLFIMGIRSSPYRVLACVAYTLLAVTFSVMLIYAFNYLATGNLSILQLITEGVHSRSDKFTQVIPYVLIIMQINVIIVFACSLKALADLGVFAAFSLTLVSIIPCYAALGLALLICEMSKPGSIAFVQGLLKSQTGRLGF